MENLTSEIVLLLDEKNVETRNNKVSLMNN